MPYKSREARLTHLKKYGPEYHKNVRIAAQAILGGKCIMCGMTDFRCLEIDHIVPKKKKVASYTIYIHILKGDISNLQLLCANCHRIKTYENNEHH